MGQKRTRGLALVSACLLYTSDAADERSSVDLGGRRIIKKKQYSNRSVRRWSSNKTVNILLRTIYNIR